MRYKRRKKSGWNRNTFDCKHGEFKVSVQFPYGAVYCPIKILIYSSRYHILKRNNKGKSESESRNLQNITSTYKELIHKKRQPNRKIYAKDFNRHFTKEEIQMAKPISIRPMEIKTTKKYHCIPSRLAEIKTTLPSVGGGCGTRTFIRCCWEFNLVHFGKYSWRFACSLTQPFHTLAHTLEGLVYRCAVKCTGLLIITALLIMVLLVWKFPNGH